jgi:hypothetical protein
LSLPTSFLLGGTRQKEELGSDESMALAMVEKLHKTFSATSSLRITPGTLFSA